MIRQCLAGMGEVGTIGDRLADAGFAAYTGMRSEFRSTRIIGQRCRDRGAGLGP
jgi:hypothetical protein